MKIGFIGLGHMGAGMVANLLRAGHDVTVYNRTRARAEPLASKGATIASDISEACRGDAVFTMLANDDAVRRVVFGDKGVLASLSPGAVHISSSTISIALAEDLERAHGNAGQLYISAPVFGRPDVAAAGNLFVVAAGPGAAIGKVSELLDAIGQRTFVVSETPKSANLIKLSGNFLIASVFETLGEAMALVDKAGIDRHGYLEILTSTLFGAPVYKTYGGLVADRKFEPAGFAAPLGHKDIRLVLAAADSLDVPMPVAGLLHDRFLALGAAGGNHLDWSAVGALPARDAGTFVFPQAVSKGVGKP
ncbi:MAG: NAD(P)-dependent oxidoreductase [Afipia sp.]|nr:NAD(P)-dependent oxidoreductase [Afipia sp.]